jgi:hypothetical protein
MTVLLVVLSVFLVLLGAFNLSQATFGVGLVCVGIAFGVWGRINQASEHRAAEAKERAPSKTAAAPELREIV